MRTTKINLSSVSAERNVYLCNTYNPLCVVGQWFKLSPTRKILHVSQFCLNKANDQISN